MLSPCYCTALNTNSSTAFSIWDLELFVYFGIWGIFCCFGALFFCSSNIFYMCTHMGSNTYCLRIVTLSPFTIESQNHLGVKRPLRSLNPAVNIFGWHPAELLLWAEWAIGRKENKPALLSVHNSSKVPSFMFNLLCCHKRSRNQKKNPKIKMPESLGK